MTAIPECLWRREYDVKGAKWEYVGTKGEVKPGDTTLFEHEWRTGFNAIVLDPPWAERGAGKIKRGADRHYPLVNTRDLPSVILKSGVFVPAKSCHMYMWATNNFLPDAIWLMGTLGFTYLTNIAWVKMVGEDTAMKKLTKVIGDGGSSADMAAAMAAFGIGQYFRGAHEVLLVGEHDPTELILFGRRGSGPEVRTSAKNIPGVIFAPKAGHSVKPDIAYELFEKRSKGPKLEMFARRPREGWESWGNQI